MHHHHLLFAFLQSTFEGPGGIQIYEIPKISTITALLVATDQIYWLKSLEEIISFHIV